MSRLPRLHSSPAGPSMAPTMASKNTQGTKRKIGSDEEDEYADQPRKLPAIGSSTNSNRPLANRTLQPSRTAGNLASTSKSSTVAPKPLTKPRAPTLTRTTRGTSAPPTSLTAAARPPSRAPARREPPSRTVSGPVRPTSVVGDDKRFQRLQTQLTDIESARIADAARLAASMEAERSKVAELQANHLALSRELAMAKTQELAQRRELCDAGDEIAGVKKKWEREVEDLRADLRGKDREIREVNEDLRLCRADLDRERDTVALMKSTIATQSTTHIALESQNIALQSQARALQSQVDSYERTVEGFKAKLEELELEAETMRQEKRESEKERRKLHNMVQELKGNIRVFCRVRPVLLSDADSDDAPAEVASISYPSCSTASPASQLALSSVTTTAMGQERKEDWNFTFDRVFGPSAPQQEVFEELGEMVRSVLDGYNVCVFAYGQTGSGKSWTMEGGGTEETKGLIPRAVERVFSLAESMKEFGWEYSMHGSFLEIYNETIQDLLSPASQQKKHEIKHDPKTHTTTVTHLSTPLLTTPSQVRTLLAQAHARRSVAATLMNEHSSRSHSVFTLRIEGKNEGTGERRNADLNLVDLAGCERLNVSFGASFGTGGASAGVSTGGLAVAEEEKERLKETQSINKSLSALGDVIAALGEKGEKGGQGHVPYRNSKLTYLLQNSLSGNSKTLMVLNLSPLAAHLNESLTSLRFATKVNNTTIGTAKKQTKTT